MTPNSIEPMQTVHESETQRQYLRLSVPATAEIGGRTYKIGDLSAGGLSLEAFDGPAASGAVIPLALKLDFADFSFSMNLNLAVESAHGGRVGGRFIDLTRRQASVLHQVLSSYMTGEVIAAGDVLNVAARENFVKPRGAVPPPADTRDILRRQAVPMLFILLLGMAALYMLANAAYKGLFTLQAPRGVVEFPQEANGVTDGSIAIIMDPRDAQRLKIGQKARVRIAGTDAEFPATLERIETSVNDLKQAQPVQGAPQSGVIVRLKPDQALPADFAGRPANAIFRF